MTGVQTCALPIYRIGLTLYKLETFLDGDMDELIDALIVAERAAQLSGEQQDGI